jgi:hypothetical protein
LRQRDCGSLLGRPTEQLHSRLLIQSQNRAVVESDGGPAESSHSDEIARAKRLAKREGLPDHVRIMPEGDIALTGNDLAG